MEHTNFVGDQIVFTSTDFDMEQAEYGSVDSCSNCGQKQIRASCK